MNRSPFSSMRLRENGRRKQSGLAIDALREVHGEGQDEIVHQFASPKKNSLGNEIDISDVRRGSLDIPSLNRGSPLSARSHRRPSQLIALFSPPEHSQQFTSSPLCNIPVCDEKEERIFMNEHEIVIPMEKENDKHPSTPGSISMKKKDLKRKASEVFGTPTRTMMTAISTTMQA